MLTRKLLLIFIILLAIVFVGLQVFELQAVADYVRPVILPLLALLYYLAKKEKSSNFFIFCYSTP